MVAEAEKLTEAIVELNEQKAYQLAEEMLNSGVDPVDIFSA